MVRRGKIWSNVPIFRVRQTESEAEKVIIGKPHPVCNCDPRLLFSFELIPNEEGTEIAYSGRLE